VRSVRLWTGIREDLREFRAPICVRSWFDEAVRRLEEESPTDPELLRLRDEATQLLVKAGS